MTPRAATRLAWSLWAVAAVAGLVGVTLLALSRMGHPHSPVYAYWVEAAVNGIAFATLGALIASRRPSNPIGWLFLGVGLSGAIQLAGGQYAAWALYIQPETLPGGLPAALVATVTNSLLVGALPLVLLLFPAGRPPSPRWRVVVAAAAVAAIAMSVANVLATQRPGEYESLDNPLAIPAGRRIQDVAAGLFIACLLAGLASLVVRFRRSSGAERQRIKWFVYAAVMGPIVLFASAIPDLWLSSGAQARLATLLWTLVPVSLPVAVAVAILRHRLYEIDRLINRTLVYGTLTAALAGVYALGVVGFQALLAPLTADSQPAIAASTLVAAALFGPLRRHVQHSVDRRFNRTRYDAARTIESFRARMRDQVDLDDLTAELVSTANEAFAPVGVAVWLREQQADRARVDQPQ